MAVAVVVVIAVGVAVAVTVVMAAAAVITPGKGSRKNPEKSSLRRKKRFPLGLLTRNGACVGVISAPINISPA